MGVFIANGVLHSDDHFLGSSLGLGLGSRRIATTLIVLADNLIATVKDAQVDVVVDGEVKVTAFPLYTAIVIIGNEVQVQTGVSLSHIKIDILVAVDNLGTRRLHARPSSECLGIAPSIECQLCLARLVQYEQGIAVVHHSGFWSEFLNTVSGDAQVDITVDGEVEVCQLSTCTAIVEDEVLVQSGILLTEVEVLPSGAVVVPRTRHLHARPVAVQVVDVTPHIEGQRIPARLVVHIDAETVVLRFWSLAAFPVVSLPALSPDIGKGTHGRIVKMDGLLAHDGIFLTLRL